MSPITETIDQAVRRHAIERPDRLAFIDPARTLSWSELDAAADRFAAILAEAGIGAGDRVGYLGPNTAAYPIALLATWRRGATIVGLNFRLAPSDLGVITEAIGLAHAVVDARFASFTEHLSARGHTLVDPTDTQWPSTDLAPVAAHVPDDEDEAMIYFTSGSTGYPKAVPLTRRAVEATIPYAAVHEFTQETRALIIPPSFHAAGATWTNYGLHTGFTHVFTDDPSPAGIAKTISDHGVTHSILVPTLIHSLLEELRRNPRPLPSLEHVGYGASPITQHLLNEALELLECEFSQVYGLSESGGGVAFLPTEDHRSENPTRLASAGKPGVGVEVQVRGTDNTVLGTGESGELWFRSPSLTKGYLNDPAATAKVLVDGWLNSRDVGYVDEDGYIYIQGRSDDMIQTGGENVYPQVVEEVIITLPGVVECAVFGSADPHWGQRVTAAIVTDRDISEKDVIDWCTGRLAKYEVPKTVIELTALPRTATGKVKRTELPDFATVTR